VADEASRPAGAVVVDLQVGGDGGLTLFCQRERDRRQRLIRERRDRPPVDDRSAIGWKTVGLLGEMPLPA
jgi:hypothetical protein